MFTHKALRQMAMILLGSAILAFGLYQVHARSAVTEGGVLGATLLLRHWFGISPSVSGLAMDLCCYALGWRLLGRGFLFRSMVASAGFSLFYRLFEQFDPLWPELAKMPLVAAVAGGLFVGLGVGFCVRAGSAAGGDDALAMSIERLTGVPIQWCYLLTDAVVLLFSLSYIPVGRILYSGLTVVISGQLIGLVQRIGLPHAKQSQLN